MAAILSLFSPLKWHSQGCHCDDDMIDRMNHSYTAIMFTIFAIVVSTKQVQYATQVHETADRDTDMSVCPPLWFCLLLLVVLALFFIKQILYISKYNDPTN